MSTGSYFDKVIDTVQFDPEAAFRCIGVRAFIMSASTIADIIDDLYLVLGERFVDARLYLGGKRAGARTAAALANVHHVDPSDKAALERLYADFYAAIGWAKLEFRLDYANHTGVVLARNSFLAQGALAKFTARGVATPVEAIRPLARCAMLSGYIAGLVSFLFDTDIEVRETDCIGTGSEACRFEVWPKEERMM